jgi:PucR C-terminal helix-turn-helix domain/GGDEF-like domain
MRSGVGVIVRRLRARRKELEQTIFARVRGDAFPPVGVDDAEYVAGLGAAVGAAVEYVLTGIERGAEGVGPIPTAVSEQARRAARVGVGLDTVLRRYVVGHALLEEVIMEEPARGEDDSIPPIQREALREALRTQASVLDRLLVAITSEYRDELERAGRSPEQRRYERVRRLLDGKTIERSELDYDLDAWHLGVIAVGEGATRTVRELAKGVNRRLLSVAHEQQSVWAWLSGRDSCVFGDVERVLGMGSHPPADGIGSHPPVVLAFGEPAQGLAGWRLTHRQAQAALVVALRRPRPFTRYADVALLAAALKDDALASALLDTYLAPLDDHRGGGTVLRETLRAYLAAEQNISSAAASLGVVWNTVKNRLQTIEAMLGRTLHPCPAELEVALQLDELGVPTAVPEASNTG